MASVKGRWLPPATTKSHSWREEPQFRLRVSGLQRSAIATLVLTTDRGPKRPPISIFCSQCDTEKLQRLIRSPADNIGDQSGFGDASVVSRIGLEPIQASSRGYIVSCETKFAALAEMSFTLSIFIESGVARSQISASLEPIFRSGTGWITSSFSGEWTAEDSHGRADDTDDDSWAKNRCFGLKTKHANTKIVIILEKPAWVPAGMHFLHGDVNKRSFIKMTSLFESVVKESTLEAQLPAAGDYRIMPCTFFPREVGKYLLHIHSDQPVEINQGAAKPSGRQNCIAEIVKTEDGYAGDLATIVEHFLKPISAEGDKIMSKAEISQIFSNAASLRVFHEEIAGKLKAGAALPDPRVGDVFLNYVRRFSCRFLPSAI